MAIGFHIVLIYLCNLFAVRNVPLRFCPSEDYKLPEEMHSCQGHDHISLDIGHAYNHVPGTVFPLEDLRGGMHDHTHL